MFTGYHKVGAEAVQMSEEGLCVRVHPTARRYRWKNRKCDQVDTSGVHYISSIYQLCDLE